MRGFRTVSTAVGTALIAVTALVAGCATAPDRTSGGRSSGTERVYYIAADPVRWDYAPDGENHIHGEPFDDDERVFVGSAPDRIGSTYAKCLYRGYTDDTFSTRIERDADDAYLGFLGPVIRAEVGDTIRVEFRNNCSFPASVHPHGVFYDKDSEGAPYADGTGAADKHDDEVPPGGGHTYHWEVPERAGPGPMEGSTAMWMYHSHSDEIGDVYAGLSGFLIVTAKGEADPDGSPADVDREVFSLYEVVDENQSPLLADNLAGLAAAPADPEDEEFVESNLMHAINGFVYGNGPVVAMRKNERVRWYLMGMGTEVDLHTPHWHGNTAVVNGMRTDVVSLLPATMATADMRPDATGTWLFHCHVGDHIAAGMQSLYRVVD
ncbi:copper-resistance protein, CopA family [Nocardia otitidiscaviarum]|uniref:Copper-resistance protein, CopA family n=2 Tax=Nocardia otitidiscaviarum TaxID=1823 RepID=A0A378YKM4_9NOCA|nr:multicopper oxidase domain-containing protein [Nocardia otitidiscaviarum]SUA77716.1 copper-resistance protein, CopA family [Nocardia otitidiscaviarum]